MDDTSDNFAKCYGLTIADGEPVTIYAKVRGGTLSLNISNTDTLANVATQLNYTLKNQGVNASVDAENGGLMFKKIGTGSFKDEYMWIDGRWELMGSTEVDLTKYYSKADLKPMTAAELQALLV